jgi:glycosyltransferase involved in cell wall biosynthesis
MKQKSILIISYYFPPSNMVAALRIYSFAKYLAEYGHQITVLCCQGSRGDVDSDLDFDCSSFTVESVVHGAVDGGNIDYYYQQSLIAERGLSRFFWKVKDGVIRLLARVKNWLFGNLFTPEDFWVRSAWRKAKILLEKDSFDIVVTSSGPISCHFIGYGLKKNHGIPWIADYRDPWLKNPNWPDPVKAVKWLQSKLQVKLNDSTDFLITVSDQLSKDFFSVYVSKVCIIENGYFPEDVSNAFFSSADTFIITYTGTFYDISYKCDQFFEGVRQAAEHNEMERNMLIRFIGCNTDIIRSTAEKYGLGNLVTVHPKISRQESLAAQRNSDVLIFFSSSDPLYGGFYSSKIFEYIISGTPIIVVGNLESNAAANLVRNSGTGFVCGNDSEKVFEALMRIYHGDLPVRNEELIESFRRDRLALRLVDLVDQLVQVPKRHDQN